MDEQKCAQCGAALSSTRLTCEYCGALATEASPEQELEAVRELTQAAAAIARGDEDEYQDYTDTVRDVARFWSTAFTPRSTAALIQMAKQVINAIDPSCHIEEGVSQLVQRARDIISELKLSDDPLATQKASVLENSLAERETAWKQSVASENKTSMIAGIVLLILLAAGAYAVFGGDDNTDGALDEAIDARYDERGEALPDLPEAPGTASPGAWGESPPDFAGLRNAPTQADLRRAPDTRGLYGGTPDRRGRYGDTTASKPSEN